MSSETNAVKQPRSTRRNAQASPEPSAASAGTASSGVFIVRKGQPQAVIVVDENASPFLRWVAGELQAHLRRLSGAELPVVTDAQCPAAGALLLVGGPDTNGLTAAALGAVPVDPAALKEGGFVLKTAEAAGRPALVIAGRDDAGTMYATYDLLERLGLVFQTTGDIIPELKPDIAMPELDVRREPALRHRGHHIRHFVMPWMGLDYLRGYLDQLAKLKCNYLEFYWYEGGPWTEYAYQGERRLIGDLYHKESGYTAWRVETRHFGASDVVVGRDLFTHERPCAPEFQACETPDEAHRIARAYLREAIAHAHRRQIEVWLGAGDCPYVPPSLGRFGGTGRSIFGIGMTPGNPAGAGIWIEAMSAMIETYPEADGYWLWLAENYATAADPATGAVLAAYDPYQRMIPSREAISRMGYDLYVKNLTDEQVRIDALTQLHYGKTVIEDVRRRHPRARLGVSLLGRSYLFPVLHAALPPDVALQSMEAAICWNRGSRVPMENFAAGAGRSMFLVPRLDDDANELAAQFNVTLYEHDRVAAAPSFGATGVSPQVGRTRGLEHNARFLAESAWNTALTRETFYAAYARRIYGEQAAEIMLRAFRLLEETDMFLGLEVPLEAGWFFCGMNNFCNYADWGDADFRRYRSVQPGDYPKWFRNWDAGEDGETANTRWNRFRVDRFTQAIGRYSDVLDLLRHARPAISAGARNELKYLVAKTESLVSHLRTCCALMEGWLAHDAALCAKRRNDREATIARFDDCEAHYRRAAELAVETATKIATGADDPTDRHILFRYNVGYLLTTREFHKWIRNAANYHRGLPYWEPVDWTIIDPLGVI